MTSGSNAPTAPVAMTNRPLWQRCSVAVLRARSRRRSARSTPSTRPVRPAAIGGEEYGCSRSEQALRTRSPSLGWAMATRACPIGSHSRGDQAANPALPASKQLAHRRRSGVAAACADGGSGGWGGAGVRCCSSPEVGLGAVGVVGREPPADSVGAVVDGGRQAGQRPAFGAARAEPASQVVDADPLGGGVVCFRGVARLVWRPLAWPAGRAGRGGPARGRFGSPGRLWGGSVGAALAFGDRRQQSRRSQRPGSGQAEQLPVGGTGLAVHPYAWAPRATNQRPHR